MTRHDDPAQGGLWGRRNPGDRRAAAADTADATTSTCRIGRPAARSNPATSSLGATRTGLPPRHRPRRPGRAGPPLRSRHRRTNSSTAGHLTLGGTHHVTATAATRDPPAPCSSPQPPGALADRWAARTRSPADPATAADDHPPPHREPPMPTATEPTTHHRPRPRATRRRSTCSAPGSAPPDYRQWRAQVEATGGCAAPIHLTGSLRSPRPRRRRPARARRRPSSPRAGTAAPRSARPAPTATPPTPTTCCAPDSPETTPRTSPTPSPSTRGRSSPSPRPSFGPVHTRNVTRRGHVIPCRCGDRHHPDDPRLGTAARPRHLRLRRRGAVAGPRRRAVGPVHHHPAPRPRRRARRPGPRLPATTPGCPTPRSPSTSAAGSSTSTPSSASTAPTDPPTRHRPGSPTTRSATPSPPPPAPPRSPPPGPDGTPLVLGWGAQLDLRPVTPTAAAPARGRRTGEITDAALAGYIAKYATKSTGAVTRRRRRPAHPRRRPHRPPRRHPAPPPHDRHRLAARRPAAVRAR